MKAREEKKDKATDTPVKICELFGQGRKVALPMHPSKTASLKPNVASMTNDLKVKELELQTLPALMDEVARLRKELKKVRTEALDFDVPFQSFEVLQTRVATIRDQVAGLLSAVGCARRRNESVRVTLRQMVNDFDLFNEVTAELMRRLSAPEAKLSGLKFK